MSTARREGPRALNWLLNGLLFGFISLALLVLVAWLTSRARLSAIFGSLAATADANGSVAQPTQGGIQGAVARLPFVACFFTLCGASLALFKKRLIEFFRALPLECRYIRESLRRQFSSDGHSGLEIAAVLMICALGVFLRVWHIGRSIRYDEAATYLNYASKPLYRALST